MAAMLAAVAAATAVIVLLTINLEPFAAMAAAAARPSDGGQLRQLLSDSQPTCQRPTLLDPKAVFNLGCRRFKRMCIDQQQFITYDPQYDPARSTAKLPYFDVQDIVYNWPNPWGNGDKFERGRDLHVPPVSIRANTSQEACADLMDPRFSNCTIPVILWQRWMFNVGEVFEASYVRLYEEFAAGRLDPRLTPVLATPYGMRLPAFASLLFGAIFEPQVTTLAELSQRAPEGAMPTPSTATREGFAIRCFETLYLCKIKNRKDDGHCAAGAHLVRHYTPLLPPLSRDTFDPDGDRGVLKVVLASRTNATGRAILNEGQLLEDCNRLDLREVEEEDAVPLAAEAEVRRGLRGGSRAAARTAKSGPVPLSTLSTGAPAAAPFRRRIKCVPHVFGRDLMYDIALVKVADVLVATHGAVGYHSFYMSTGSSLVEVLPYRFSAPWVNLYYARMLEYEKKVFYWSIWVTDADNSRASAFQDRGAFRPEYESRERHVTLPWAVLRRHLLNIVKVAGRPMSYKELYMAGEHSISDTLKRVPNTPDTGGQGWASYGGPA